MTLPEVRRYLDRNPEKRPRGRTLPVDPQAAAKLRRILEEQKEQSIMSNPSSIDLWSAYRDHYIGGERSVEAASAALGISDADTIRLWGEQGLDMDRRSASAVRARQQLAEREPEYDDSEAASPPLTPPRKPTRVAVMDAYSTDDLGEIIDALRALTTTAELLGGTVRVQMRLEVG